jgi:hypothetical protein
MLSNLIKSWVVLANSLHLVPCLETIGQDGSTIPSGNVRIADTMSGGKGKERAYEIPDDDEDEVMANNEDVADQEDLDRHERDIAAYVPKPIQVITSWLLCLTTIELTRK